MKDARTDLERRLQEVYDSYYSQESPRETREAASAPLAPPAHDGVDTYVMPPVDAHHGWGIPGRHKDGYFTVQADQIIVHVEYRCDGDFCGWCYHPSGGYGMACGIIEGGNRAHWQRYYDGKPVKETYTVYWKWRRPPIEQP